MQVSFGKIVCEKEVPNVTHYQKWIAQNIIKAFDVDKFNPYVYGEDKATGAELTFHEYLKNKKGVDVVITAQKEGGVSVALKKTLFNSNSEKVCSYVVSQNSYTPYQETFNYRRMRNPQFDLDNILRKFIKRCKYFANH